MFKDYSFRFAFTIVPRGLGIPYFKLAISLFRIGFDLYATSKGWVLELLFRGKVWYITRSYNPFGYIQPDDKYTVKKIFFGIKIMHTHDYERKFKN